MKHLLWFLALCAAAAAIAILASNKPGYVLLVYPPYRIELSLTMFVILLLSGFMVAYVLIRLTVAVLLLPEQVREYRKERSRKQSQTRLQNVVNAFFEGRYGAAEETAGKAVKSGETSVLFPIIAARSAHELRDFRKRDEWLATVPNKTLGDTTMRLTTTGKFMLDQRDPQAALDALGELRNSGVQGHEGAMSLELRAQQQAGNWDEVLSLLASLEEREAIDTTMADQLRQQAWIGKLRQQDNLNGINTCLKLIPAEFRRRSKVAAAAAQVLIKHDGSPMAQKILTDSLNAQWDSELVTLYGDCRVEDGTEQIEQAEKWLNLHQQDAGLLLALGKLCLNQKLWGKAQSYLDASISIKPSPASYNALGQLAEQLGKSGEAHRYYKQAAALEKQ